MLDLQNALIEALQHFGALEISALLVAVILLSVWLIVRMSRRTSGQEAPVSQRNVLSENASAPKPELIATKPVTRSDSDIPPANTTPTAVQSAAVPEDSVVKRDVYASGDLDSDVLPKIPQDSVLKRHFFAQLQAEVEAYVAPRPSESVLLRHYQAMVAAELEKRLSAFND